MEQLLITTDLDRTIVPNGTQPESQIARPLFHKLVRHPKITLAYVSGRNIELLKEAIAEYELPIPDYAIGDVGTTIYEVGSSRRWRLLPSWEEAIAHDWRGKTWEDVRALLSDIDGIRLQDDSPAFQNTFKVSYYTESTINRDALLERVRQKIDSAGLRASLIWSVDEQRNLGLFDVLPESATKLHAIQWLQQHLSFSDERTVFAGDSGNDMPALTSKLRAIVVKNARQEVKDEAQRIAATWGFSECLYIAGGNFLGMNGNYAAGVLEGISHFFPETKKLIEVN